MISNLFWIMAIAIFIALFWQQRRQSEMAKFHIERRCEQLNLQIISIARDSHYFTWLTGPFSVTTKYCFEFSANGLDCHQGFAIMRGNRLTELFMPPYPI